MLVLALMAGCGDGDDSSSGNADAVASGGPPNSGEFLPSTTDLDFELEGGTQQELTFQNNGTDDVSVGVPKIDGSGAERFSIDDGCENSDLSGGDSCSIVVKRGGPSNVRLVGAQLTVPSSGGDAEVSLED